MPPSPKVRRHRLAALLTAVAIVFAACGDGTASSPDERSAVPAVATVPVADSAPTTTEAVTRPTSELAALVQPAGSTDTLPEPDLAPRPVAFSFDEIGVPAAPVIDVGVEANGDMEIPGAAEVGWYRYGPTPGSDGSAVLAAHIAWNGEDGVFRRLAGAQPGQRFTVGFDDGTSAEYEIVAMAQYPKDQLPAEVFATTGEPRVVLITCGGSFNRALSSYDDNVVAHAVPVNA
jgi:hypothetical protein